MPKNVKKPEKKINTLQKLIVEYVDIDSIHPNEYNPNRQSEHDFELLCRSIEEDGFTQPIVVNREKMEIVDGEHRWRALKFLGKTKAPVCLVDMSIEQQMISTLRHNRARGSEDINMAADVLKELQLTGDMNDITDSLLLDPIDVQIMLVDIPQSELKLRTPGEKLTVKEVEQLNKQEEELQVEKKKEERIMEIADMNKYTFQFTYTWPQGWIIERLALGRLFNLNKAEELVKLCHQFESLELPETS